MQTKTIITIGLLIGLLATMVVQAGHDGPHAEGPVEQDVTLEGTSSGTGAWGYGDRIEVREYTVDSAMAQANILTRNVGNHHFKIHEPETGTIDTLNSFVYVRWYVSAFHSSGTFTAGIRMTAPTATSFEACPGISWVPAGVLVQFEHVCRLAYNIGDINGGATNTFELFTSSTGTTTNRHIGWEMWVREVYVDLEPHPLTHTGPVTMTGTSSGMAHLDMDSSVNITSLELDNLTVTNATIMNGDIGHLGFDDASGSMQLRNETLATWLPIMFWLLIMIGAWSRGWIMAGLAGMIGLLIEILPIGLPIARTGALMLFIIALALEYLVGRFRLRDHTKKDGLAA
jgi:hypothetical protein